MKDCVSASGSIEPWLTWFSYLTASLMIGAIQNNVKWLLSHKFWLDYVEISSEAQKGHV